jgi:hypothetical protein
VTAEPPDDQSDEGGPTGRLAPTTGAALAVCAVVGLVGGWLLHPLMVWVNGTAPVVTWLQALALLVVAALVGLVAWHTWRTLQVHRLPLEPHRAVNRLVLARACALAGALVTAGYLGYAVSWLGDESAYADRWILRALVAAAGAGGVIVASLVLERACRADGGQSQP